MNKTSKLNKCYVGIALLVTQGAFAANFDISPYGTLPTTVTVGQSVSAYYTVKNMTNTARYGYVLQGLPTTVNQNTTSPNCTNPINLEATASCQLQLDITAAVSSNFAICKGSSCTTATTPLNVSLVPVSPPSPPSKPTGAYVSNYANTLNDSVTYCILNPDTNFIDTCQMAGGNLNVSLSGVILNNEKTMAFLTTYGTASVYQCMIDPVTGLFDGTCSATPITVSTGPSYSPAYGLPTFNATDSILYLLDNAAPRVLACSVSNNTLQTPCVDTGATNIGTNGGVQLVLNSSNTLAYIASYDGFITQCQVSNNGQLFNNCTQLGADNSITLLLVTGLALTKDNAYLYLTDNDQGNLYRCSTTVSSNKLTNCTTITNLQYGWTLTLNPTNSTMYVAGNYSGWVKSCPVNSDGSFGVCSTSNGSGFFNDPTSVALF